MNFYVVLFYLLACGIPILCIVAITLFVSEGKKAKIEGRRRKLRYKVFFIFGLILLILYLVAVLFCAVIMIDIAMNGM